MEKLYLLMPRHPPYINPGTQTLGKAPSNRRKSEDSGRLQGQFSLQPPAKPEIGGTYNMDRIREMIEKHSKDGKINCKDALGIAETLSISAAIVGKTGDEMKIKIKGCQLGCFK
jgi:hypothetical protein